MRCSFLCSLGTSPVCDCRVILASPCTPPHWNCTLLFSNNLNFCHIWSCHHSCSQCDCIHSRVHIDCQSPGWCIFQLYTTVLPCWCLSWQQPVPSCSPLQQRLPMIQRNIHSTISTQWSWGSPDTILGWETLRLGSTLQIPLTSTAALLCLFPFTG